MGLVDKDQDAELMIRLRDHGDSGAFEQLYKRFTPPLISFLVRMVRDAARAEELAQDVFLRIYQARDRYEPRAKFSTYLFGIASNLALNDLDRAHRKRERPLETMPGSAEPIDDRPGLADEIEARLTGEKIERALAALPARQRAALLMRSSHGLSYAEIADELGASESSVKSLLHRARAELLSQLKEDAPS